MQEKPVALKQIGDVRATLAALEDAIVTACASGDCSALPNFIDAHHKALAAAEAAYLSAREWTADPDFAALGADTPKPHLKPHD